MITITATIIACYHKEKKASRARRQAASDSVRYANSGQNIAYVVQPTPGGVPRYVTAPQGMVFVPVVPGVPTNQVRERRELKRRSGGLKKTDIIYDQKRASMKF